MKAQVHPCLAAFLAIATSTNVSPLLGQMAAMNGSVAEGDLGRPARPPFITLLGVMAPGRMATDPSLSPTGPVSEVLFEELRLEGSPGGPAGEVIQTVRSKYNEQGRVVEEYRKVFASATNTINAYEGTRLVSQESTLPEIKPPQPKSWDYWKYDDAGKLIDYRRGRGDALQNHETNFTRDKLQRLTSFEYRQGPKDELFSRTAFRYSPDGKSIDTISYDAAGEVSSSMIQTMNGDGRVTEVVIRERGSSTKKLKSPIHVAFCYDPKGRLVLQNTDSYDFKPEGGENELPPGKVVITYDDVKHTRRTEYSSAEGEMVSTMTYDSAGAVIGAASFILGESTEAKLQCDFDTHGNWTSCDQVATGYGISKVAKRWRRTITYR